MAIEPKIICNNIWKVFGPNPERTLRDMDRSLSRAQVQEQTGHVVAVKDVSFSVSEGETFVVMGLSGSGKSTLVRCLSRLINPTEGQVLIDGNDITAVSHSELENLRRYKMSMVFQHFGLFPHRKVIDNVAYGLEVRGEGRQQRYQKAMETIELVEPFSALDPLIRREMQDELLDLQSRLKKTMVFITHDFLEAIKMGDKIMIMRDGAISQMGTPEEIVANPADKYVADFTEDVPRYKVLSAGKVMRAVQKKPLGANDQGVALTAKIDDLIDAVTNTDVPLSVVDEQGMICGEIDRSIVMKSMKGSL